MTNDHAAVLLFSYGTLKLESVQRAQFGRLLVGRTDALPGYARHLIEIIDPQVLAASGERFHPIVVRTGHVGDTVDGMVFELTEAELQAADDYEVDDYRRVRVTLASSVEAWVYVQA